MRRFRLIIDSGDPAVIAETLRRAADSLEIGVEIGRTYHLETGDGPICKYRLVVARSDSVDF